MSRLPASIENIDGLMNNIVNFVGTDGEVTPYLRMDAQDGTWTIGLDATEIEADALWGVDITSFTLGYSAFDDTTKKRIGQETRSAFDEPIDVSKLQKPENSKDGWQPEAGFKMICLEGRDKGLEVKCYFRSVGGRQAFVNLFKECIKRYPKEAPAIKLTSKSYKPKNPQFGKKKFAPIYLIDSWHDWVEPVPNMDTPETTSENDALPEEPPNMDTPETTSENDALPEEPPLKKKDKGKREPKQFKKDK